MFDKCTLETFPLSDTAEGFRPSNHLLGRPDKAEGSSYLETLHHLALNLHQCRLPRCPGSLGLHLPLPCSTQYNSHLLNPLCAPWPGFLLFTSNSYFKRVMFSKIGSIRALSPYMVYRINFSYFPFAPEPHVWTNIYDLSCKILLRSNFTSLTSSFSPDPSYKLLILHLSSSTTNLRRGSLHLNILTI